MQEGKFVNMPVICKLNERCIFLFQGQGPLWTASFHGHLNVVKAGGSNVNQADNVGYT